APEQLQGKPRQSSDLYSLAVVLYEWLTGERPFQGTFAEVASQHLFTPPPSLRGKVPAISPAVEQVVLTALAKDPKERFGSVRALANAFLQASGASTSFPSLGTKMAPSGAQLAVGPSGASGILVSAESQQTPRITPQLAAPSGPGTPGTQPAPSIYSVATQIT